MPTSRGRTETYFRYLSARIEDGPVYDKKGPLEFTCYTDSDYAGCKDTRKSVSGNLLLPGIVQTVHVQSVQFEPELYIFFGSNCTITF